VALKTSVFIAIILSSEGCEELLQLQDDVACDRFSVRRFDPGD
jgi:hypothetical protein